MNPTSTEKTALRKGGSPTGNLAQLPKSTQEAEDVVSRAASSWLESNEPPRAPPVPDPRGLLPTEPDEDRAEGEGMLHH
jgi:hypothetical protein